MDRFASRVGFAVGACALVASLARPAGAQTLATLHVRTFTMQAEPASMHVGETFALTIVAHVDERVVALDNVTLPDLSGYDVMGDERRCTATARGSDCSETLTLASDLTGDRTIGATIMDAIDGRNGKPSRFSTNTLAIHVAAAPPRVPGWVVEVLWAIVLAALPIVSGAFVIYALFRRFGERRPVVRPQTVVSVVAPPPVDRDAELRALVVALASEPTRARALAVRAALRERVGARDQETLADIGRRYRNGAASHSRVFDALAAVEVAAFCEDRNVAHAVEEALPSLNF